MVIESIARIAAPAIVHDTACRIPAMVSTMLAMLPSSITGLEAKGSSASKITRTASLTSSKHDCNERGWIKWRSQTSLQTGDRGHFGGLPKIILICSTETPFTFIEIRG